MVSTVPSQPWVALLSEIWEVPLGRRTVGDVSNNAIAAHMVTRGPAGRLEQ